MLFVVVLLLALRCARLHCCCVIVLRCMMRCAIMCLLCVGVPPYFRCFELRRASCCCLVVAMLVLALLCGTPHCAVYSAFPLMCFRVDSV